MQKTITLLALLPIVAFAGCERSPTLAKVGGQRITQGDLEVLSDVNPRLKPRLATEAGKRKILENYVEQALLYREANRRGLQRTPETKQKLDLYKKVIIAQALLDDELNRQIKEYYDNHRDEFERVKIAHVLIRTTPEKTDKKKPAPARTEAAARKMIESIQQKLAKGEDFGKIASDLSEDSRTKKEQGGLGYVTLRDKRLERWGWLALAENAFALKNGEVSQPVNTVDGIHLVKVLEEKKLQPFEEAESGIRFRIQSDVRQKLLDQLKEKYKVVYVEAKKPAAATPTEIPPAAPGPSMPPAATPEVPPTPPSPPAAPQSPPS